MIKRIEMRIVSCLLFFLVGVLGNLHAQQNATEILQFSNHGEVYFRINNIPGALLETLPQRISIDSYTGTGIAYAYADTAILADLMKSSNPFTIEVLPHPGTLINPVMASVVDIKSIDAWDFYPTYEAYVDMMYQFQENYPGLCEVFSIGQTEEGHEILVAVISNNPSGDNAEPQVLYTSSMHGDELTGFVLFLRLIDHLLSQYETDFKVKNLVDNLEIWINPLANPDGTYAGGNASVFGATRFNANGVDINRNFPDPKDGDHPDGNPWQIETIHFMDLAAEQAFVLAVNCHGGAEVYNYPWDTWEQLPADDAWWIFTGREWADTVHAHSPSGYFDGFDGGISNGYQWYSINGGRQDYMNYFHHCREFTLEISDTKMPVASLLPGFWQYNYRSFLNYMAQALYGIRGTVRDAATGQPLQATVYAIDHDIDGSWVVADETGWFFRPVIAGSYDLMFLFPGL